MSEKIPLFSHVATEWRSILYAVGLAATSGVIGYLSRTSRTGAIVELKRVITSFVVGGLNGYLMFLVCDMSELSWQLTAILTGASGALGNEMLGIFTDKAKRFME